jgi:hypothetical protein
VEHRIESPLAEIGQLLNGETLYVIRAQGSYSRLMKMDHQVLGPRKSKFRAGLEEVAL